MQTDYIEEEITLAEFASRFLGVQDLESPEVYDVGTLGIEVQTLDSNGEKVFAPIETFVVKEPVSEYYTDGKIKVSASHRFIEAGKEVFAKDHTDFKKVSEPLNIVDIEVPEYASFLANGRLNHNTTSGGKAIAFHASVRLRLSPAGMIKVERNGTKEVAGIQTSVKVVKNRMGPPLRTIEYPIYFDRGIDDNFSLLEMLKTLEIVTGASGNWKYVDTDTGEVIKFVTKNFKATILEDARIKDQMYKQLCEKYILKYKDNDIELTDELTIDSTVELSD